MRIVLVFLILGFIFLVYKKIKPKKPKNLKLDKFKKSKLNGEMIFQDDEQRIYKFNNGTKVYL